MDEGLGSGEEAGEEREFGEGGDLGICSDGGFSEDGETNLEWLVVLTLEKAVVKDQAHKPTMSS